MNDTIETIESYEAIARLSKDLKAAVVTLTPREVRYLVDTYYQMQENRKVAANQIRALNAGGEPHAVIDWLEHNARVLETQIKAALNAYAQSQLLGEWAMQHIGIGPVIASGLMAHIDVTKAPTYGHVWSFAGLTTGFNMPVKWEKGQKRPWNAQLKTLCWKMGDSFVKFSNHEGCFYGREYRNHKAVLIERNTRGDFKDAAAASLAKVGKDTECAKHNREGRLSPGHIDMRARRYAVKLFLSHWWEEAYRQQFHKDPPAPYPVDHLGHAHVVKSPVKSLA